MSDHVRYDAGEEKAKPAIFNSGICLYKYKLSYSSHSADLD